MKELITTRYPLKVGQYYINGLIGKGNYAVVKMATHIPTGTKVAVKIIEKSRLNSESLKRFLDEIQILKMLDHPHLIKLFQVMQTQVMQTQVMQTQVMQTQVMQTEKMIYLVMDYASGGEISDKIVAHGRMNEREARHKLKQILSGMLYCEQLNIVHQDLKTENILLDNHLNVKIADFGFSVITRAGEMLTNHCGSPSYASPELFEEVEYDGAKVDIWSLGIVLYVMVVGKPPFIGNNINELKKKIKEGDLKFPFFMGKECQDLIRRLLVKDPHLRISLMEVVNHEWMAMDGVDAHFEALIQLSTNPPSLNSTLNFNPHIISCIKKTGFSEECVLESLRERKFDKIWATYHILLEKHNKKHPSPYLKLCQSSPPSPTIDNEKKYSLENDNRNSVSKNPLLPNSLPSQSLLTQAPILSPISNCLVLPAPCVFKSSKPITPSSEKEDFDCSNSLKLARYLAMRRHTITLHHTFPLHSEVGNYKNRNPNNADSLIKENNSVKSVHESQIDYKSSEEFEVPQDTYNKTKENVPCTPSKQLHGHESPKVSESLKDQRCHSDRSKEGQQKTGKDSFKISPLIGTFQTMDLLGNQKPSRNVRCSLLSRSEL